jgi:TRAP-type C4-dicarboxylate transport system substrate-binding protein
MTIRTTFAAAALAALTAVPAFAQTTWEMPTPYPEAEFHTRNVRQFVEDVAAATDGALTINVHSAQSLFKHPEIKRAVQTGQVQIAEMLMANLLNENAVFGVDAVPFLATSYDDARKLWEAQRPHVDAALEADGLMLLYAVPWPGQGFYSKEPLEGPEDLEGVKFRTYNAATARMAELMGAEPTIVEAVEIPQAFSTGVVDAMVTSGATGVRSKAWDFSNHFYDLNAWLPKNMIFVNRRAFMQLP